jgi:hypothetical protein
MIKGAHKHDAEQVRCGWFEVCWCAGGRALITRRHSACSLDCCQLCSRPPSPCGASLLASTAGLKHQGGRSAVTHAQWRTWTCTAQALLPLPDKHNEPLPAPHGHPLLRQTRPGALGTGTHRQRKNGGAGPPRPLAHGVRGRKHNPDGSHVARGHAGQAGAPKRFPTTTHCARAPRE